MNTTSKQSAISKIGWDSPIDVLFKKTKSTSKTSLSLQAAGIKNLSDLLFIAPLKVQLAPKIQSFEKIVEDDLFFGQGKIIRIQKTPAFGAKRSRKVFLQNIDVFVKDDFSEETLNLKWFNTYPSVYKSLENREKIRFLGTVKSFRGRPQIINPEIKDTNEEESNILNQTFIVRYPTINKISPTQIAKAIEKIPKELWEKIPEIIPEELRNKRNLISRSQAYKTIHGKINPNQWKDQVKTSALQTLIYEEFYIDQLKIIARKKITKEKSGIHIKINKDEFKNISNLFPYQLTPDQINTLEEVLSDFESGHPMMRLIQGDVGSGKTTIALFSALVVIKNKLQTAMMCPTESLAIQHHQTITKIFKNSNIKIELLIGSTSSKEKTRIYDSCKNGEIQFIIGTHALIQDDLTFKNLGLVIIDEQHKFGVEQRIKLTEKGKYPHCLIMTATPIPRSLSLTRYGDLDISIIKSFPSNRRGTQTRIVSTKNFQKFLEFLSSRIAKGEQAYIVVPAIEENEHIELMALEKVYARFQQFFPNFKISSLHGKMASKEKAEVFNQFTHHKIDILISTSVVEVGIDVHNATIMAILNPERFGLSSLHQLRGRVGRGSKPGFCFLIMDKEQEPSQRLKTIEQSHDGFVIAEADLEIRGEGDLFGKEQSGKIIFKRFANPLKHANILYNVHNDVKDLLNKKLFEVNYKIFQQDPLVHSTI